MMILSIYVRKYIVSDNSMCVISSISCSRLSNVFLDSIRCIDTDFCLPHRLSIDERTGAFALIVKLLLMFGLSAWTFFYVAAI